jgi:hypothetical protein
VRSSVSVACRDTSLIASFTSYSTKAAYRTCRGTWLHILHTGY